MKKREIEAASLSLAKRLPYCHICMLEDYLNNANPKTSREAEMLEDLKAITTSARRWAHQVGRAWHGKE